MVSAPQIDIGHVPRPLKVSLGGTATVSVKIIGDPRSNVKWQIGRKRVRESSKYELKSSDDGVYSLVIKRIGEDLKEGIWVVASNSLGEDCCQIEVEILAKPLPSTEATRKTSNTIETDFDNQSIPITPKDKKRKKSESKKTASTSSLQTNDSNYYYNNGDDADDDVVNDSVNKSLLQDTSTNSRRKTTRDESSSSLTFDDGNLDEPYTRKSKRLSKAQRKSSKLSVEEADLKQNGSFSGPVTTGSSKKKRQKTSANDWNEVTTEVKAADVLETDFDNITYAKDSGEKKHETQIEDSDDDDNDNDINGNSNKRTGATNDDVEPGSDDDDDAQKADNDNDDNAPSVEYDNEEKINSANKIANDKIRDGLKEEKFGSSEDVNGDDQDVDDEETSDIINGGSCSSSSNTNNNTNNNNNNCKGKINQSPATGSDEDFWFINGRSIIDLCKDLLRDYKPADEENEEEERSVDGEDEDEEQQVNGVESSDSSDGEDSTELNVDQEEPDESTKKDEILEKPEIALVESKEKDNVKSFGKLYDSSGQDGRGLVTDQESILAENTKKSPNEQAVNKSSELPRSPRSSESHKPNIQGTRPEPNNKRDLNNFETPKEENNDTSNIKSVEKSSKVEERSSQAGKGLEPQPETGVVKIDKRGKQSISDIELVDLERKFRKKSPQPVDKTELKDREVPCAPKLKSEITEGNLKEVAPPLPSDKKNIDLKKSNTPGSLLTDKNSEQRGTLAATKVSKKDDETLKNNLRNSNRSNDWLSYPTDNVSIFRKPPVHSTLGKPPAPPQQVIENKPLVLTAYVVHKKHPGYAHNTPRRQKRTDKNRCRSADPLGPGAALSVHDLSREDEKELSSESLSWDKLSGSYPTRTGSSTSGFFKSNLVPTRSEEYLVIRKSDGRTKSLNASRENMFRSFQSLDRLNDSETGSMSSRMGLRTLSREWQIVTVTTTEETFLVPKKGDNPDGSLSKPKIDNPQKANLPDEKTSKSSVSKQDVAIGTDPIKFDSKNKQPTSVKNSDKAVETINKKYTDASVGVNTNTPTEPNILNEISDGAKVPDKSGAAKSSEAKPSTEMTAQQTEPVKIQNPSKQVDGFTQTGTKENTSAVPVLIPESVVVQANVFEFNEVNKYQTYEPYVRPFRRQQQKVNGKNLPVVTPSIVIKSPSFEDKTFSGNQSEDSDVEKSKEPSKGSKPVVSKPIFGKKDPFVSDLIDLSSDSEVQPPPPSPNHYSIHQGVKPFDGHNPALFTPGNHAYSTPKISPSIPGNQYVIEYTDGKTPTRELKITFPENDPSSREPQKFSPSSPQPDVKADKNKASPEKKRDRSVERVVETFSQKRDITRAPSNDNDTVSSSSPVRLQEKVSKNPKVSNYRVNPFLDERGAKSKEKTSAEPKSFFADPKSGMTWSYLNEKQSKAMADKNFFMFNRKTAVLNQVGHHTGQSDLDEIDGSYSYSEQSSSTFSTRQKQLGRTNDNLFDSLPSTGKKKSSKGVFI